MSEQPNILLILTDQHRLSAIGSYGDTPCRTPNLDRLAAKGTRFERAYTTCPLCSPARATVMTGAWPLRHGVTANMNNMTCACHTLRNGPEMLPRRMQGQGYRTGYTGKWHLGYDEENIRLGKLKAPWPNIESLPRDFGFDGQNFPGHGSGGFQYEEYQQYLKDNGWEHNVVDGELTGPVESTVPYFLASHTMSLIDQYEQDDAPFFIWHNFWGPHGPYRATRELNDIYRDMELPPWPNFEWPSTDIPGPHQAKIQRGPGADDWDNYWQPRLRRYYAFTTMIDAQIGRLMDHLEARGIADDTIIVFAADHGETLGSHGGLVDKGFHHFEEIQRIPMIACGPGVEQGTVREELTSLADLMPTFCDLAGEDGERDYAQGRSLVPLMQGEDVPDWRDDVVVEFDGLNHGACTIRTLRHGPYKYGLNLVHPDQLYDLDADPWETQNLIEHPDYQNIAQNLRERLFEWMKQADDQSLCAFRTAYPEAR
ncbi:MAG: sulfatase-like hydrolase/transferase [Candidatus Brocadiia bacterium]